MIKLNSTTYQQIVKDDPKDRIVVEIGDSKQSDFKPQMKLMRWDNEVNFSMRAEEEVGATLSEENGVIKYKAKDYEVHQYEKPDVSEDGGFEFEWILNKKPASNILRTTIQHKGLDFFYQPELTQEEKDGGFYRPDNVIGSYVAYASERKTNYVNGKLYKTGQFGIIYRPKIIDSAGLETWGTLNIENGILNVEIPQKYLDEAVYPVRHATGLTIGYTTLGGSLESLSTSVVARGNVFTAAKYTASTGDTIIQYSFGGSINSGSGTVDEAAYTFSGGVPVTRLQAGTSITVDSSTKQFFNSAPVSHSLSNGIVYVICEGNLSATLNIAYNTGTSNDTSGNNNSTLPATWSQPGTYSNKYSIYATYTAGGGSPDYTIDETKGFKKTGVKIIG